jgi:hypothetical protein
MIAVSVFGLETHDDDIFRAYQLLLAICLLAANAFYVAAEFALVKSRGFRINAMAEEGPLLKTGPDFNPQPNRSAACLITSGIG